MGRFFGQFFRNIIALFSGEKLLWQVVAIIFTFIAVLSGLDWKYFLGTRFVPSAWYLPGIIGGALIPILTPIIIGAIGVIKNSKKILYIALALGEAALSGSLITSGYKIFTGRIAPNLADTIHNLSAAFNFGFFRNGIIWGWPSSHTTIAFAMAVALIYLYPKNKVVAFFALLYALYVGLAVSVSIHWFSDFIAGIIFGFIIGMTVGKSFARQLADISLTKAS
jgi:membrane-associated phospholipid phosphatase